MVIVEQRVLSLGAPLVFSSAGAAAVTREETERLGHLASGLACLEGKAEWLAAEAEDDEVEWAIHDIHDSAYVSFLQDWSEKLAAGQVMFDPRFTAAGVTPTMPVFRDAYKLAREGCRTVVAASRVRSESGVYALCRPPGHHAGPQSMGGYCLFNNAVICARELQRDGFVKVAIVDFDFHLGDGTAELVEKLPGLWFGSVHHDPCAAYPFKEVRPNRESTWIAFSRAPGQEEFCRAVESVLDAAIGSGAEAIVVSLGYDVLEGDPHGSWSLPLATMEKVGTMLATLSVPWWLVQEGGYDPRGLRHGAAALVRGITAVFGTRPPQRENGAVEGINA